MSQKRLSIWNENVQSYTHGTLRHLAQLNGHTITKVEDCDYLLVSLNDIGCITTLVSARKKTNKKIIVGGCMSYMWDMLLNWADYVNVGEGFEFFKDLKEMQPEEMEYIATKDKPPIRASFWIDWRNVPLIKTSPDLYYYLLERGCRRKCAFCYTSWSNKWQKSIVDPEIISKIVKGEVNFVMNDFEGKGNILTNTGSMSVNGYLSGGYKQARVGTYIHLGVEGFSEKRRTEFGKPIKTEQITEVFKKTLEYKHTSHLFLIAGLKGTMGEVEEFISAIPVQVTKYPAVFLKVTYFEPTPGTPLEQYDLRELEPFDFDDFKKKCWERNQRVRTTYCPRTGEDFLCRPIWRSAMRRATRSEAKQTYDLRKENKHAELIKGLRKISENLLTGENLTHITSLMPNREKLVKKQIL